MKKSFILASAILVALAGIWFIRSKKPSSLKSLGEKTLRVGVTAGPHAMIMERVKFEAVKQGLKLEIVEFNDFLMPNEALNQEEIDVNIYQHQPFLQEQLKTRGYSLVNVAKSVLMPMGLYSQSIKKVQDIPDQAIIAIPNDPTNEGRALIFLEQLGLIKLGDQTNPTLFDIIENPRNLQIKELEAPTLVMTLPDVDAAIINTDWIVLAGVDPKTALATESVESPFANIIVVKKGCENNEDIKKLIKIYQGPEVRDFIIKTFGGAVIPAWG